LIEGGHRGLQANKPLRKLDYAHYDVTGHEVKWYKQTSGRSR